MDTDKKQRSNWTPWVIVIAIIAFGVVFGSYWTHFGEVSTDTTTWGTFGDYVGGTLNPLLSFLALCALLWTIRLQIEELETSRIEFKKTAEAAQEQVNHFKSESQRTDLYRIIEKLAGRVEQNLNTKFFHPKGDESARNAENYGVLSILDIQKVKESNYKKSFERQLIQEYGYQRGETFELIKLISSDLERLASYIEKYQSIDESLEMPIHNFYREEFGSTVTNLYGLGLISKINHDFYRIIDKNKATECLTICKAL